MKEWILKQNQDLRNKIREDVKEIVVGPKSPAGGASNLRQSNRLNTNSKGKTDASPPKKTGNTETRKRKRKQVEVHSLSSGSESAGDIEGEEDVQSTWKEDGNAPSSGTFDECDDYGGALKITQEGDVMQEESDFDHCSSNCTKMKESMMREIENLELKLQLYGGHGLNNLTYDELLHFEHQLESSLHIARAHKQEQQQQQTDKLKENLISLQELDLSNNQIHALPDTFGTLDSLTKLNVDQNPLVVPPEEVVKEGVEAVKTYMGQRRISMLEEEEKKKMEEEMEQANAGWLTRTTSKLKTYVADVSEYLGSNSPRDPYLERQL